jgi:cysteine desulfurase
MKRIYLDHNAAVPPVSAALAALREVADTAWGNPASAHQEGQAARANIEKAREQVAAMVGVTPGCIFFTSGGTEAAHAALHGVARREDCRRIVISSLEHPAVRGAAAGLASAERDVVVVPARPDGTIDPHQFLDACRQEGTVAAMILAHNETGILQPVDLIAEELGARNIPFIVDSIQAPGRIPGFLPAGSHVIGLLASQKIGGMPGAGAVIASPDQRLVPFMSGGEEERRRRGGTPPVALIAAMGAAAQSLSDEDDSSWETVGRLRDRFETGLLSRSHQVRSLGSEQERLINTCTFLAGPIHGEDLVAALDLQGVAVSSGSACSTGSSRPSASLIAMGYSPVEARSMLRVSLGLTTTEADIDQALTQVVESLARLQERAPAGVIG